MDLWTKGRLDLRKVAIVWVVIVAIIFLAAIAFGCFTPVTP